MNFNNKSIGVLKFHYKSKQFNIADWEIYYDDNYEKGNGMGSLKRFCETLPQNLTTVIFCKGVKLLYILNKNTKMFEFGDGSLSSTGLGNYDFFSLRTKDETIEFREWDNFFDKVDDCEDFYNKFYCAMEYFKCYNVSNFGKFTLSNDCFKRGVQWNYSDFIGYGIKTSMRKIVEKCIPKDPFVLEFFEEYWRGGMAFYNPFFKDQVYKNITSFDKKSCHLAAMVFEKFPLTDFTEIDPTYWFEVEKDFEETAFIAEMKFEGLVQKNSSVVSKDAIWRFGFMDKDSNWWIKINEIDWKWFKEEFKWDKAYIGNLYVAQKTYMPKDFVKSMLKLYEAKEQAKKGTIWRQLAKQCTELPYGQSIKRLSYGFDAQLDENGDVVVTQVEEPTFEEKQEALSKRIFPLQLGIWTVSYSRLDIWKATNLAGSSNTVYCDTDCIKVTKGTELQFFLNKEIEEKAKLAARRFPNLEIPKNLGRWDYEYTAERFIVAGIKWYAYEAQGKLGFKAAGAQLDVLEKWFKTNSLEKFNTKMDIDGLFKTVKYDEEKHYATISYNSSFNEFVATEQEIYETII